MIPRCWINCRNDTDALLASVLLQAEWPGPILGAKSYKIRNLPSELPHCCRRGQIAEGCTSLQGAALLPAAVRRTAATRGVTVAKQVGDAALHSITIGDEFLRCGSAGRMPSGYNDQISARSKGTTWNVRSPQYFRPHYGPGDLQKKLPDSAVTRDYLV